MPTGKAIRPRRIPAYPAKERPLTGLRIQLVRCLGRPSRGRVVVLYSPPMPGSEMNVFKPNPRKGKETHNQKSDP